MNRRLVIVAVVFLGFWAPATIAQQPTTVQAAIDAYRSAIISAESGTTPKGIEAALTALSRLQYALLSTKVDRNSFLESLSEKEFQNLKHDLLGVRLNRQEVLYAEPDVDYFARLAATKGDDADQAFFSSLKATYPDTVWPVYIEQQTDYSGCTRFGSMSLVDVYQAWSGFRSKYPERYIVQAQREAEEVLGKLTTSTCACGDAAGVVQELEQFQVRFATSPARSKIDVRLDDLRAHRSSIRINCQSG